MINSYNYASNNPESISGDVVYSLLLDNARNLWICLFDGINIQVSCENLLWIVNNILDQAKIESGTMHLQHTPFNPSEVLEQVYKLLNIRAREKELSG